MRRLVVGTALLVLLTGAAYPAKPQMDAVRDFVEQRDGIVGVAVVDSEGRLRGANAGRRFVSASVIKAMLLVAYLRDVEAQQRGLARWEKAQLRPMIRRSSNRAAWWTYYRVGDPRLRSLARRAGMDDFSIHGSWAGAQFSARDQAKFFWRLERLTPKRFRAYALELLSSIRSRQSWGIPRIARPRGFEVFHKPGWRPGPSGYIVHQAAHLTYRGLRFSVAVLSEGNRSYGHGMGTISGVTRRLIRDVPQRP